MEPAGNTCTCAWTTPQALGLHRAAGRREGHHPALLPDPGRRLVRKAGREDQPGDDRQRQRLQVPPFPDCLI